MMEVPLPLLLFGALSIVELSQWKQKNNEEKEGSCFLEELSDVVRLAMLIGEIVRQLVDLLRATELRSGQQPDAAVSVV